MAMNFGHMTWLNEPDEWQTDGQRLTMRVTPHTDFWRISHYGFTVDDGPFLYTERGGEFEAGLNVAADYHTRFDQAGLMLRIDHENYIKAGIELADGRPQLSCVVTHRTSDWSVAPLPGEAGTVWLKAVRRLDAVEIFYSTDGVNYAMMRNAWMQDNVPMLVGPYAASPDGDGFAATFSHFSVRHLPDLRRLEWLKGHAG